MKLFETYSSTLSNITYFRTVLFSYAQLKGMKISEGIFNLAASSKKWTESLTLNISTYKKKYLGLVIQFSFFLRIGPNWKHLLKFSHLCLLRKPQQAAQLLATQNPPWKSLFLLKMLQKPQTTKWHVHDKAKTLANSRFSPNSSLFSLFLSRHNMYLGTRYSLSQRGQNHYDVVYSPRVNMGDFNVKRLKVWKILWICKGMRIYKRLQKYFESIVPVKQSIFAAVLFTWHNHYHFVILFVF